MEISKILKHKMNTDKSLELSGLKSSHNSSTSKPTGVFVWSLSENATPLLLDKYIS